MLSYPSSMSVSSRALNMLAEALRHERRARRTRWRRLEAGEQALLVLAYLRKGETYTDLAGGFGIGLATVFRYIREALDVLAAMAIPLTTAVELARRKAFVTLDGTLLRIDRVGMTGGRDRPFYSGKHKRHGLNVQVLADPAGRLIWTSPALPGARHDMGAAREHGIIDALNDAGVRVLADSAYRGAGANVEVPHRRPPRDPETGERRRRLSANEKAVNTAHARLRGPGERANAQLKSWRILRKIRSSPRHMTRLVDAIRSLIHAD
ncbi:transposase family protein [Saccharopolyspora dendranthemae]|uniref:DDE superfamily endonuclease n=1 Tax=Saccharopolyspora dendranthemae TaxID=1181886 RepID=A0A561VAF1_9PSEU|nr:transposase family protein [Saccharopolyspora dendranthemae]TWG08605.1 DDE superfamily endonuclease [Saccharopolyspora dendranthemae]